jgi:uncharacterized membrane protein
MNDDMANQAPSAETLAVGLGWFSIALGVAELAAPYSVARFIGVAPTEQTITTLRASGAREVGNGMAILAQPDRATWLWSRAAGDALDLASLGAAPTTDRGRATLAAAAVLGVAALDVLCARKLSERADGHEYSDRRAARGWPSSANATVRVREAITINQPLELVENQWNRAEHLPASLRSLSRSHEAGAERAIVEFKQAPGDRGTEVRIELEYSPRGGAIGAALAKVFGGDPTGQLRHDLRRFKQLVETGEVVLSDGPALWRPAQPAEDVQEIRRAAELGV